MLGKLVQSEIRLRPRMSLTILQMMARCIERKLAECGPQSRNRQYRRSG